MEFLYNYESVRFLDSSSAMKIMNVKQCTVVPDKCRGSCVAFGTWSVPYDIHDNYECLMWDQWGTLQNR